MTARTAAAVVSVMFAAGSAACVSFYEINVETPIIAKLDVSAFQRVLVPGFLAGGSKDVDTNTETVRLLRSQLRTKSDLKVIDSDVISLVDVVDKEHSADAPQAATPAATTTPADAKDKVKSEKDLQAYEQIFADVNYWKKLGEEYQSPLIVTGQVLFTEVERSGFVEEPRETIDNMGRKSVESVRQWRDRKGFSLSQKIIFIDGHTGAQLHSENYTDETLYSSSTNTPPLSAYFELMDKRIPDFLNTLTSQKIKGTRFLVK